MLDRHWRENKLYFYIFFLNLMLFVILIIIEKRLILYVLIQKSGLGLRRVLNDIKNCTQKQNYYYKVNIFI